MLPLNSELHFSALVRVQFLKLSGSSFLFVKISLDVCHAVVLADKYYCFGPLTFSIGPSLYFPGVVKLMPGHPADIVAWSPVHPAVRAALGHFAAHGRLQRFQDLLAKR